MCIGGKCYEGTVAAPDLEFHLGGKFFHDHPGYSFVSSPHNNYFIIIAVLLYGDGSVAPVC